MMDNKSVAVEGKNTRRTRDRKEEEGNRKRD